MGNNSAKQVSYQDYYNKLQNNSQSYENIDLNSLDPYKVLNIHKNFTWDELKNAYKDAAIKTHPDKGGNKLVFDFVTSCFKTLAEEYKNRESNKNHFELKKSANEYFDKITNNENPHPSLIKTQKDQPFQKIFNNVFDECHYHDEDISHGYGDIMDKSDGKRDDISINNIFNNKKIDNDTFNDVFNKNVPVSSKIIKYKEPEALPMAKNLQFTEIGAKKSDDYSSDITKNTLAYTDYMIAYNGMRLANPDDIKYKRSFKSIQEYEKYSNNKIKKGLSQKERQFLDDKVKLEEQKEYERLERIKMQNLAIQKANEKARSLLA